MTLNIHDIPMDVFFKYFNKINVSENDSYENIYTDLTSGYYVETLNCGGTDKYIYSYLGDSIFSKISINDYDKFFNATGIDLSNATSVSTEYKNTPMPLYEYSLKYLGLSLFDRTPFRYCAIISNKLMFNINAKINGNTVDIIDYSSSSIDLGSDFSAEISAVDEQYIKTYSCVPMTYKDEYYINSNLVANQWVLTNAVGVKIGCLFENKPVQVKSFDLNNSATKNEPYYFYKSKNNSDNTTYSFSESTFPLSIFERYHEYARKIKQTNLYIGRNTRVESLLCSEHYPENKLIFVKEANNHFRLMYKVNYKCEFTRTLLTDPSMDIIQSAELSEIYSSDNYVFIEKEYLNNPNNYVVNTVFDSRSCLTIPSAYEKDITLSAEYSTKNINIINMILNYIKYSNGCYIRVESEPYSVYYIEPNYEYDNVTLTLKFTPLIKHYHNNTISYVPEENKFDLMVGNDSEINYYRQSSNPNTIYESKYYYTITSRNFEVEDSDEANVETFFNSLPDKNERYCGFDMFNGEEVNNHVGNSLLNSIFLLALHTLTDSSNSVYTNTTTADPGFLYKSYLYCSGLYDNIGSIKNKMDTLALNILSNEGTTYLNINDELCSGFIPIENSYVDFVDSVSDETENTNIQLVVRQNDLTTAQQNDIRNQINDKYPFARILQYIDYETTDLQEQKLTKQYKLQNSVLNLENEKIYQTVNLDNTREFYRKKRYYQDFKRYIVEFYSRYYSIANTDIVKKRYEEKYINTYLPKLDPLLDDNNQYKLSDYTAESSKKNYSYHYIFTTNNDSNVMLLENILKERGL